MLKLCQTIASRAQRTKIPKRHQRCVYVNSKFEWVRVNDNLKAQVSDSKQTHKMFCLEKLLGMNWSWKNDSGRHFKVLNREGLRKTSVWYRKCLKQNKSSRQAGGIHHYQQPLPARNEKQWRGDVDSHAVEGDMDVLDRWHRPPWCPDVTAVDNWRRVFTCSLTGLSKIPWQNFWQLWQ